MASVIAFRASHCIIDLTAFDIPMFKGEPSVTIPGIYNTITNLLDKNIIPIIKCRHRGASTFNYWPVQSLSFDSAFANQLSIDYEDVITSFAKSPIG